jgi:molybdate transport system ATP-binding protein
MIAIDIELVQGSFELVARFELDTRAAALFGPSGSGKTTILDSIAGLRTPRRGTIAIDRRVLYSSAARVNVPAHQRRVGYVPQDVALFPHMNVRRNLLYGPTSRAALRRDESSRGASGRDESAGSAATVELALVTSMLEIDGLLDRRVTDLSGGERQRVALGRALMSAPSLLLLDEPLAAVDVPLRRRILPYLRRVRDELRIPIVYVSHDRAEVDALADHVVQIAGGLVTGVDRVA